MKYGFFDDKNKEYIITNPHTPVKWINYVGTLDFGGFIDHTGGSLICKGDPAVNRITKYIPQLPASNFKGETLYLRVKQKDTYKIFSPYYVPTLDNYDRYECHIGLLYSRIISEFYGIKTEITIFVPTKGTQLIRDIKITNISTQDITIDAIPVVEYTHPDALKQFTNADWIPQTMQSKVYNDTNDQKILLQYPFMTKDFKLNYFTSNLPVSSFETDRKVFLGKNEYGTWKQPLSLLKKELENTEALRGDNIAALLHHLGSLKPGETKRLITQLGQAENINTIVSQAEKYRNIEEIEKSFNEIVNFWDEHLSHMQVNTPNKAMNSMLNIHNPRQCYITKNWSRYLSLYQLGFGARGVGFRDSSQDVMGILLNKPLEGKELIKKLLHMQKRDGSAMHQFNPITMIANEGDSREEEDRPKYYGDDHLWIILAVSAYLKETGDTAFLDEIIPFYDKDNQDKSIESATILEHLKRAIEFTHKNTGKHGLPLLGFADWNDTVNLKTGAESLFIASQYGCALLEMIDLARYLQKSDLEKQYINYYEDTKEKVNKYAWDGNWYIRYFDYDGTPIGSNKNSEGKIYTNAQSWAIMSGFATPDRKIQSLESLNKYLNTTNGIKISYPGYNKFDPNKGGITTYPPGAKENGGIFLHTNPWVIIAETLNGNGNRAFKYYDQINPAAKNEIIDTFECAPYNYPQNILGDEHPQFGLARNSWLSGTSSWTYQAATKYILGILPTYQGLQINPCIPNDWPGFSVTRLFRGVKYEIKIKNPHNVSKGISSIKVNGNDITGNIIPFDQTTGQTCKVEVIMG